MDAQVWAVLGRVLAQRRSVAVAFGYVTADFDLYLPDRRAKDPGRRRQPGSRMTWR